VVLMDLVRLVEELAGRQAILEFRPAHPADVPATWADIGRAEQFLGWRPQVPFRQGVERLVDWYRDNRDWAREIETNSR
ncbi:MAG: nucleotide sugar epimerase, partial [Anaerolineae bacterium]|nr:nucleotide sugar epimerase [Anaerolineae bacterium]